MAFRVYCGGLPASCCHSALKQWCSAECGLWPDMVQIVRKYEGETLVSAFLGFSSSQDAEAAIFRLQNVYFWGYRVTVKMSRDSPAGQQSQPWKQGGTTAPTRAPTGVPAAFASLRFKPGEAKVPPTAPTKEMKAPAEAGMAEEPRVEEAWKAAAEAGAATSSQMLPKEQKMPITPTEELQAVQAPAEGGVATIPTPEIETKMPITPTEELQAVQAPAEGGVATIPTPEIETKMSTTPTLEAGGATAVKAERSPTSPARSPTVFSDSSSHDTEPSSAPTVLNDPVDQRRRELHRRMVEVKGEIKQIKSELNK